MFEVARLALFVSTSHGFQASSQARPRASGLLAQCLARRAICATLWGYLSASWGRAFVSCASLSPVCESGEKRKDAACKRPAGRLDGGHKTCASQTLSRVVRAH